MPEDGIVVDRPDRTVRISRRYAAGVDRVWWAWTDADAVATWWGPRGWTATVHEMDVRPGGRWRFEIAPADGSAAPVRGVATYTRVVARARLDYDDAFADEAWRPDGTGTFPTAVTFTPFGPGCRVEVAVRFADVEALRRAVELRMATGYAEALDRLDHQLEAH